MNNLGIEALTVFGLHPVRFIELAGRLECGHISTGLNAMPFGPHSGDPWSLRDNPALQRDTRAAMAHWGVDISLAEGLIIRPGVEVEDYRSDMELFKSLGAVRVNTVIMDPDRARGVNQLGRLAQLAASLGLETTLELPPTSVVGSFADGIAVLDELGQPNLRLLVDTMHFVRGGSRIEELATVDPQRIGYIQLSDVPLVATGPDYMDEAMFARLPPGEGELPLRALLEALPRDLVVSLEVPSRTWVDAGDDVETWAAHCVAAARPLLAQVAP